MVRLQSEVEKVAGKIFSVLRENFPGKSTEGKDLAEGPDHVDSVCCIHRHRFNIPPDQFTNFLRYDVIKMMIRANDYSHALCFHIFDGSTEFHVYSKKGWVSFCPEKDSIIITVGDQFQVYISSSTLIPWTGYPMSYKSQFNLISTFFLVVFFTIQDFTGVEIK